MRTVWMGFAILLVLGCASVDRRIAANQEAFDRYPPGVQAAIRRGEIAVGFTEEQVLMALGEPDRRSLMTADERVSHVWTWRKTLPGFGIGFGTGQSYGNVGVGSSISTGTPSTTENVAIVEFVNGRVTAFERMEN